MKLNFLFTDNMVFQRNKEIRIWGECETGAEVFGTFRNATAKAVGKDGRFMLSFPSFDAGKGYELAVKCNDEQIVVKNIAVGEVWIAGGQSNMEMPVATTKNGEFELQFLKGDNIRYITVPRQHVKDTPCVGWHFLNTVSDTKPWKIAGNGVGSELSAVAYYFAKRVSEEENVPVGIIECNWGGTSVYNWISREDLLKDKDTYPFVKEHFEMLDNMKDDEYKEINRVYLEDLKKECPVSPFGQGYNFKPITANPESYLRMGGLYDTMLSKIVPFMVKGILWYQGESDAGGKFDIKSRYKAAFKLLKKTWQRDFKNPDIVFITTLLAGFGYADDESWGAIREAQTELMTEDEQVYCINCADNGEEYNIHPFEKRMLGERMAGCALSECYDKEYKWQSPLLDKVYIENNKVVAEFKNTYNGLIGDNVPIEGFEVRIGGEWKSMIFIAKGNKAWSAEDAVGADCVRYAHKSFARIHLYNSLGLPAFPFNGRKIK